MRVRLRTNGSPAGGIACAVGEGTAITALPELAEHAARQLLPSGGIAAVELEKVVLYLAGGDRLADLLMIEKDDVIYVAFWGEDYSEPSAKAQRTGSPDELQQQQQQPAPKEPPAVPQEPPAATQEPLASQEPPAQQETPQPSQPAEPPTDPPLPDGPPPMGLPLPAGWKQARNPADGRSYYFRAGHTETTWERPMEPADAAPEAQATGDASGSGSGSGNGGGAAVLQDVHARDDGLPSTERIGEMLQKRQQARQRRDWPEADRIRDSLEAMGVQINDTAKTWRTPDGRYGATTAYGHATAQCGGQGFGAHGYGGPTTHHPAAHGALQHAAAVPPPPPPPPNVASGSWPGGSWACEACGNMNFPSRVVCNKHHCGWPRPLNIAPNLGNTPPPPPAPPQQRWSSYAAPPPAQYGGYEQQQQQYAEWAAAGAAAYGAYLGSEQQYAEQYAQQPLQQQSPPPEQPPEQQKGSVGPPGLLKGCSGAPLASAMVAPAPGDFAIGREPPQPRQQQYTYHGPRFNPSSAFDVNQVGQAPPPSQQSKALGPQFRLFVGRMPDTATDIDLRNHFGHYGPITDAYLPRKCFGFVTFAHEQHMRDALAAQPHYMKGEVLEVKKATPRADR